MRIFDWFKTTTDRRSHSRRTVVSTAWLRVKENPVPMVCVLWDLSEGGARLSVSNPQEVPDEVSVALRRDERNGTRCRVVWRSNDDIGVQFIQNAEPLLGLLKAAVAPVA